MLVEDGLLSAVERWDLSRHPYWNDFHAGQVSRARVALLAHELGRVIPLLSNAWDTVNDLDTSEQAIELAVKWNAFGSELEAAAPSQPLQASDRLVSQTRAAFLKEHTALGALATIHRQLPLIARQLQRLLDEAYPADGARLKPFTTYADAHPELAQRAQHYLGQYSSSHQAAGVETAETVGEALWELFIAMQNFSA